MSTYRFRVVNWWHFVGPSGAGKSTLLHVAGLLEYPDGGDVTIADSSCAGLPDDSRTALRRTQIDLSTSFIIYCQNFRRWKT